MRLITIAQLFVLLAVVACARLESPEGWSGGVLVDDKLFIGTMEGAILVLQLDSGEELCRFELRAGAEESIGGVYGTPAVSRDTLFIGGYDGFLYALPLELPADCDKDPWEPDDREPVGDLEHIVGSPVVVDDVVLVGSSDGNLYAFDYDFEARDLSERWTFPTGNKIWGAPAVEDGVVYFGSLDHNLYAVLLESGEEAWPKPFTAGGAITAAPVVSNGRVYVGAFDSIFYAIDAQTGEEVARFEGASNWYWGGAVATENTLYAPSLDGNLYALDMRTLAMAWPEPLRTAGSIIGSPVIVGDRIAVPSLDGKLRVAKLLDGGEIRLCDIGAKLRAPITAHQEGVIYFGATDRSIRALAIDSRGDPDEEWVHSTNNEELPVDPNRDPQC